MNCIIKCIIWYCFQVKLWYYLCINGYYRIIIWKFCEFNENWHKQKLILDVYLITKNQHKQCSSFILEGDSELVM